MNTMGKRELSFKKRNFKTVFLLIFCLAITMFLVSNVSAVNWNATKNEGLVAYWNFTTNIGTVGGMNLTYGGTITNVTGINGTGVAMAKGSGNYVRTTSTISALNFTGNKVYTVNLWEKLTATCTSSCNVYTVVGDKAGAYINTWNYQDDCGGGNGIWATGKGSNLGASVVWAAHKMPQNGWVMITMIFNGTTVLGYWNGTLYGTKYNNTAGNFNDWSVGYIEILGNQGGTQNIVDEVGIWNRTLSQSEITDLYNSGAGMTWEPTFSLHTYADSNIYSTIKGTGAGLGRFILYISESLPVLILILAIIGIIIAVGWAIVSLIRNNLVNNWKI